MQSDFYSPICPWHDGMPLRHLFAIQDIEYHAQLKRNINLLYTKASMKDLEPKIDNCVMAFVDQVQKRYEAGYGTFDMGSWLHFYAFDCLGEINVSKRFGFLEAAEDIRGMIGTADLYLHLAGLVRPASMDS